MKSLLLCSATLLAAASLMAADKDDVMGAAQKLADADSYSWTTTREGGRGNAAPSHGKTQKDGLSWMDMTRGDNTTEVFFKGTKGALKTDDGWEALDLADNAGGGGGGGGGGNNPGRFMGRMLRNFKAPAAQLQDIVSKTKDMTKSDDSYTGDLTEEGAKSLLTFGGRGRRGGGGGAGANAVSNAKGSLTVWVKDGVVTKFVTKVSGTRKNQDGDDVDVNLTTTTEVKDIGGTKITVPDDAKSKLG